jgi:hypothetical protein
LPRKEGLSTWAIEQLPDNRFGIPVGAFADMAVTDDALLVDQ